METQEAELLTVPEGWKDKPFTREDNPRGLIAESSFSVLFPSYREGYLSQVWPLVEKLLSEHGIEPQLDLIKGTVSVRTTRKAFDPFMILKARDLITLLARSVDLEHARKVLDDDIACDIIKIGSMVRQKERFAKRRQRLIGPKGTTLKAMECLTDCYVCVQGNTVAVIGPHRGLKEVRKIAEDCMKNIHPFYTIRLIMEQQNLAKIPDMKDKDWDLYLPSLKNKKGNSKQKKKPIKKKEKKPYTPFPPPQIESKVDKELASGEYFLKEKERRIRKLELKEEKTKQVKLERIEKRKLAFIPPPEEAPKKKRKTTGSEDKDSKVDLKKLQQKFKKIAKK